MRNFRLSLCCLCLAATHFAKPAPAQQLPAVTFLQKIASAYNAQGRNPESLSISASANWTAGSQRESGSIVETVLADGSTSESWIFPTVSHTQVQGPIDLLGFSRVCSYTDATSKTHDVLGRNCFQGVPWFDPSFVLNPAYTAATVVTDVSTAADSAQGLVRLSYAFPVVPAATSTSVLQSVSNHTAVTIAYDIQTALPQRLEFQQATDQNDEASIDVAVTFGDYGNEGGFMVPHHISRYMQRTLVLDIVVTNVSVQ
jgi:hypothetical protein